MLVFNQKYNLWGDNDMKVNDVVKIKPNSKYYDNKIPIPNHIINDKWIVMSIKGDRVVIDKNTSGTKSICSTVNIENLEVIEDNGYVGRNMHISSVGLSLIMDFEGCSLDAYRCPAGVWTIGYGHIENVHEGDHITKQQAINMLNDDMKRYESYVNNYIKTGVISFVLNQNMFDALTSFCYNCGNGNLKHLVSGRNARQVADAMLLYNKANGKELAGLTRRRKAERELFLKK